MEKRTKILLVVSSLAIILLIIGLIFYKHLAQSSASSAVTKTPVVMNTDTVNLDKGGTGTGTIASNPTGISCGSSCSGHFSSGVKVVLTEIPASDSTFAGWSGPCSGLSPTCTFVVDGDKTVKATFNPSKSDSSSTQKLSYLNITKNGAGTGTITSVPLPVNCGNSYNDCYPTGTKVTLVETPSANSSFSSWGGVCATNSLTINSAATSSGTILGIVSGSTLAATSGKSVNINPSCVVTLAGNENATATFVPVTPATTTGTTVSQTTYNLTVTKTGDGTGTIVSDKGGIACGNNCNANLNGDTDVTLTATPATGYYFSGWGGTCSGLGSTCVAAMVSNESVTASFTKTKPKAVTFYNLSVVTKGALVGDVISTPGGIDCGPSTTLCTASFDSGTKVTLVATLPDSTTAFSGWSGICSGTGNCSLTMTGNQSVTATFGSK
jgi:hypothetical protein